MWWVYPHPRSGISWNRRGKARPAVSPAVVQSFLRESETQGHLCGDDPLCVLVLLLGHEEG